MKAILCAAMVLCAAVGQAAPHPARLMLVVDRSSSNEPNIRALRGTLRQFAERLDPARVSVGMVVFGASAVVAFPLGSNFLSASPNLPQIIDRIEPGSHTGTAEALSLAYMELNKEPDPEARNIILLITDGSPNTLSAEVAVEPQRGGQATVRSVAIASWALSQPGQKVRLLLLELMSETCKDAAACAGAPIERVVPGRVALPGLPSSDLYGNATTGEGYRESRYFRRHGIPLDLSARDDPYQACLAAWNAADNAAARIRSDRRLNVQIVALGLESFPGPVDRVLLQRISTWPDITMMHDLLDLARLQWKLSYLAQILNRPPLVTIVPKQ